MSGQIQILDCTLRDGAYIVDSKFGTPAIKGIIKKMQDANIDIIECGWLKNNDYKEGTTFYHVPSDITTYILNKNERCIYVSMIDWDRYDLNNLPINDGKSIDAIRVVFPYNHFEEGIALGQIIKEKGYQVYFQAANTLDYSDDDLVKLAECINEAEPVCLSVVDTFGAMYGDDLEHIVSILDRELDKNIKLGFHSHNNQQLAFSNALKFVELLHHTEREIVVDSSLSGMGRGAGNATTELLVNYLNKKHNGNYDLNAIMDAIDMYMGYFIERYQWGYSTPYFISGIYCAHVNNIAYLLSNHRTNAKDMRNIIEALPADDRKKYDYDLLEQKYLEYQNKVVDDEEVINILKQELRDKKVLLILPGKSVVNDREKIDKYIEEYRPVVIGINAIVQDYKYDYLFFCNTVRYDYAKEIYADAFRRNKRIVASNIKINADENEMIVNFNLLIKRGWEHFDNSGIMCLRLLDKLQIADVAIAGFDGFKDGYNESYADVSLPHINPGKKWEELNEEIKDMYQDFRSKTQDYMNVEFVTESYYEGKLMHSLL